jgi:putative addiction module component (TIGR02574 family)
MSPNASPIFDAALALPEVDRLQLAGELLASVKPPGGSSIDDADFDEMLSRRSQELRDGAVKAIPAEESIAAVRRSLEKRGPQ